MAVTMSNKFVLALMLAVLMLFLAVLGSSARRLEGEKWTVEAGKASATAGGDVQQLLSVAVHSSCGSWSKNSPPCKN
ncbi:hypothetical protein BS78_04G271100 [Paspalum vaginatum]|nr:hypothetical protein BS78_04G271100 [Paspalum vaginatum]